MQSAPLENRDENAAARPPEDGRTVASSTGPELHRESQSLLAAGDASAGANYQTMGPVSSNGAASTGSATGQQRWQRTSVSSVVSDTFNNRASRSEERRQFEAARQDVVREAVVNQSAWTLTSMLFLLVSCVVLIIPLVVSIYVEVVSWHILLTYFDKPCDQNLAVWLLIRNLLALTAPAMPPPGDPDEERARLQRLRAWEASIFLTLWLAIGYTWTMQTKTCKDTNPELYSWVKFITIFGLVVHFLYTFFQLLVMLIVVAYHFAVGRGWIKSPSAADDQTIELMEQVVYTAEAFPQSESDEHDDLPPSECCCCMESFGPDKTIVRTPCSHFYHYDCLKEWLRLAKTCPICRADLDSAAMVHEP
mmetsp:Transcript_12330/g.28923  ORF Transcript_12330/g.28923 Transcript_12330/m.28923 type:complete len:364 (+) Transcript_12330:72-1163(+)